MPSLFLQLWLKHSLEIFLTQITPPVVEVAWAIATPDVEARLGHHRYPQARTHLEQRRQNMLGLFHILPLDSDVPVPLPEP